jgi:ornithine cyclodeaminase/alanine dehydrogenase-like protein (mu-crystallin family)
MDLLVSFDSEVRHRGCPNAQANFGIGTCTRSHDPLVKGVSLKPGVHLDLVGGYTPQTREADDEAARRALIFVDRRESAFDGVGDILQPIANGAIQSSDERGDLYDLVPGTITGRRPISRSSKMQVAATWT